MGKLMKKTTLPVIKERTPSLQAASQVLILQTMQRIANAIESEGFQRYSVFESEFRALRDIVCDQAASARDNETRIKVLEAQLGDIQRRLNDAKIER